MTYDHIKLYCPYFSNVAMGARKLGIVAVPSCASVIGIISDLYSFCNLWEFQSIVLQQSKGIRYLPCEARIIKVM